MSRTVTRHGAARLSASYRLLERVVRQALLRYDDGSAFRCLLCDSERSVAFEPDKVHHLDGCVVPYIQHFLRGRK